MIIIIRILQARELFVSIHLVNLLFSYYEENQKITNNPQQQINLCSTCFCSNKNTS